MSDNNEMVGGLIYSHINYDERVTPDLSKCIYCVVTWRDKNASRPTGYDIPLDCIQGNKVKQCPACKTIFILRDPTEP